MSFDRKTGVVVAFLLALVAPAEAQWTSAVSLDAAGDLTPEWTGTPSISGDGRFVMFYSLGPIVASDTNGVRDLYLHDRVTRQTELLSVSIAGVPGNGASWEGAISDDGRFVVFESDATNFVPGDTNGARDIYLRDRKYSTTVRVSVGDGGWQANGASSEPAISADGRYVTFSSYATNLVIGDSNAVGDVFVRDVWLGKTERVSVRSGGNQALGGDSELSSVSADGRYVAFTSRATNLAARDTNGTPDVFLRDRVLGTTLILSRGPSGAAGNSLSNFPSVNAQGTAVAYCTLSTDIFPNDANPGWDVVVFNVLTGQNILASKNSDGVQSNGNSLMIGTRQNISGDGRLVTFSSRGTNMLPHDGNGTGEDIFVHDRFSGVTQQMSVHSTGQTSNGGNANTAISADGRHVAFMTWATNLVPGDTNGTTDIVVRSPWLTLSAEETSVVAGQTLKLTTWRGAPAGEMVFGICSIQGFQYLLPIVTWKFSPLGDVEFKTTVPALPLLQGLDIGFRSGGLTPAGTIDVTQDVVISFE